ncbi:MAG: hypothetical protein AAF917_03565 [Pseudomonadota bacterium]
MPARFTAAALFMLLALTSAVATATPPVVVVNQQDKLPEPRPIEDFIDTRGMSQRKFSRAVKSWEGATARSFDLTWSSELQRDFERWLDGERVYRIDDQDLQRIRKGLRDALCSTQPCWQTAELPLSFADDATRRIRSCTITFRVVDGRVNGVQIDNDGCRFNANERNTLRYDPERHELPSRSAPDASSEPESP